MKIHFRKITEVRQIQIITLWITLTIALTFLIYLLIKH